MDEKQIESLIGQLKAGGLSDDEIMSVFYEAFKKGKTDRADLEVLANAMGYELDDGFKSDSEPDPIESGEGVEGLSKDELEDARALEPGETAGEFEDRLEGMKGESESESEPEPESKEEGDEGEEEDEEDWKKAQKAFRI